MLKSLVWCAFAAQCAFFATIRAEPQILRRSPISNSTSTSLSALSMSSEASLSTPLSTISTSSSASSRPSQPSTSLSSSLSRPTISPISSSSLSTSSSTPFTGTSSNSSTASSSSTLNTDSPICTGCVLEANYLITLTYSEAPLEVSSYIAGTITTVESTDAYGSVTTILLTNFDPGATPTIPSNQTDVHLTLTWTWDLAPDVTLTAPNTYLAYYQLAGGLDGAPITAPPESAATTTVEPFSFKKRENVEETCTQDVHYLDAFPPEEGNHQAFIYQITDTATKGTVTLPPPLISYLSQMPAIMSAFNGSDIGTCTLQTTTPEPTTLPVVYSSFATFVSVGGPSPTKTSTLVSSTFATAPSVIHISASEIRSKPNQESRPASVVPVLIPTDKPKPPGPIISIENHPSGNPKPVNTEGVGGILASLIHNNPSLFNHPPPKTQENPASVHTGGNPPIVTKPVNNQPIQSVAVGNTVVPVVPAQVSGGGIVIGGQTLTPGQVVTSNGVIISVPPGGSSVVVGGSTIAVNPANPTPHPVLTVDGTLLTANPSGEFVIGTQTLKPNGPALTIAGTTFSLGPFGTVAVVNGVTQTLNAGPQITGPPALIVGGQTISAIVVDGTTLFVLGPGKTLTSGGELTVDGTTYSLPWGATPAVVVVNGVTSTLNNPLITAAPLLTVNGQVISATVVDGTTQYVLGPGTTLIPGGPPITVSGTTFSLPPGASILVINGHTSSIAPASVSATTTATDSANTGSASSRSMKTSMNSGSKSKSSSKSSSKISSKSSSKSSTSSTTSLRAPGNFIASGIGISTKPSQAPGGKAFGLEALIEGVLMGIAGWLLVLL